jgi:hypothetical protein
MSKRSYKWLLENIDYKVTNFRGGQAVKSFFISEKNMKTIYLEGEVKYVTFSKEEWNDQLASFGYHSVPYQHIALLNVYM